jgi:hemerythrin-like domain-containing protein
MTQEVAEIVAAIEGHHAAMVQELAARAAVVVETDGGEARERARHELVAYIDGELLPHAQAEEATLYARGADDPGLATLVASMIREHEVLKSLRDDLARGPGRTALLLRTGAFTGLFETHAAKENEFLVPGLVAAGVDIGALLGALREELIGH